MSDADITAMRGRLDVLQKCIFNTENRLQIGQGMDFYEFLVRKNLTEDIARDAESVAPEDVSFYLGLVRQSSPALRIQAYFNALNAFADVQTHPPAIRLKAKAYSVYYDDFHVGNRCPPLDADILQVIGKAAP